MNALIESLESAGIERLHVAMHSLGGTLGGDAHAKRSTVINSARHTR